MGLCILLYVSPSSHKEDTVAQEITTQTFPQETAALPGCSPTDNRSSVWHEFVVKKWPYQNWVLLFYSIVALLNIDFWAWDKPTTFGPDSCFTGLLEAWTLPSRETRPWALRFVGIERHDSETNSSDLLKNPRKYWKKQKVWFIEAETKKHLKQNQDSHVEALGGRYTGKKVSPQGIQPTPSHASPSFSWAQTHHWMKTPHKRHTKYKTLRIEMYRNVKKISTPKNRYKATRLCKKKGILTPCGVSSVEGMLMDPRMLPLVRSFRKSTRTHWWASSNLCTSPKEEPWDNNWTTNLSRRNNSPY